jgi:hypothetical protein
MGRGDEIMVTGEVVRAQRRDRRPAIVLDKHGRPRWHALWEGSGRIIRGSKPPHSDAVDATQSIVNGPGARPYIDYAAMRRWAKARGLDWNIKDRRIPWRWIDGYAPVPGEIAVGQVAARWARDRAPAHAFVVVEPHIKPNASPNKDWGRARWQALVALRPDLRWVQLGPESARTLDGVTRIATHDFGHALAILALAKAFIGTDGALHHAAAALGVSAAVIWAGYAHPRNLGYAAQVNLHAGVEPCGSRLPCDHCRAAIAEIPPEQVAAALDQVLK